MLMYHVGCCCLWSVSETKRFYPVNIPSYFLHWKTLGPWCFCTTENKTWWCRFQHIFLLLEWASSSKSWTTGLCLYLNAFILWHHQWVATWGDSWPLISIPHYLTHCQTARPLEVKEVLCIGSWPALVSLCWILYILVLNVCLPFPHIEEHMWSLCLSFFKGWIALWT